jgi:hypothetical protein
LHCVITLQSQLSRSTDTKLFFFFHQVIIITNSDDGWVRYSCERIVPSLLPTLDKYKIVSARTQYEKFYPGQPLCWKAAAFAHEASESLHQTLSSSQHQQQHSQNDVSVATVVVDTNNESPPGPPAPCLEDSDVSSEEDSAAEDIIEGLGMIKSEIISFGDSMEERTAVRIVSDQLDTTPKSVMFVQSPNPYQIVGQLRLLTNHMDYVCNNGSTLDLEITLEQAIDSAKAYFQEIGAPNLAADDFVSEVSKVAALRRHNNGAFAAVANTMNNKQVEAPTAPEQQADDDPMQEDA